MITCILGVVISFRPLLIARAAMPLPESAEVLYLPNGDGLRAMSFGYQNALANLLWFNTISYFGKHYASDQNYKWLAHMCDLVTTLDPKAQHVYEFGAVMLAWEVNAPAESIKLLDKAIANVPEYWRFPYLRGFTRMYFIGDQSGAAHDFKLAATLPEAPPAVASLAAKNLAASRNDPKAAVEFLSGMLASTTDASSRNAILARLKEAQLEVDLRALEQAVELYRQRYGRAPQQLAELVSAGIVAHIGRDPFGGEFLIDPQTSEVGSTSGKKRFKVYLKEER